MKKENITTIMAVAAFVLAGGGAIWYNASQVPQGMSMEVPDTSNVKSGGPIADVRVPAQFSEAAVLGKRVFNAKCAACHGENAAGRGGIAPPFIHQFYRPGHHSDEAFLRAAKTGVIAHHWNFGDMPPVGGLTDGDVKYIARYVRELQKENGIN